MSELGVVATLAGSFLFGCLVVRAVMFVLAPARVAELNVVSKAAFRGPIQKPSPEQRLRDRYLADEIEADEFEDELGRLFRGEPSRAQEAENRRLLDEALAIQATRRSLGLDVEARGWADAQFRRLSGQKPDERGSS